MAPHGGGFANSATCTERDGTTQEGTASKQCHKGGKGGLASTQCQGGGEGSASTQCQGGGEVRGEDQGHWLLFSFFFYFFLI